MSEALTRYGRESLRLDDFSDRELVAIIGDVCDAEGWASRRHIAQVIFPFIGDDDNNRVRHAMRCVSIRLSWLRRFGVVDKRQTKAGEESEWIVTADGRKFLRGTLGRKQMNALEGLSESQLVAATTLLTNHYRRSSPIGANLVRREWIYGANRRNGR